MKEINVEHIEEKVFYGLSTVSDQKHLMKNVEKLKAQVSKASGKETLFPYVVLTKNFYQEQSDEFQLFVGIMEEHLNLEKVHVPQGWFAKMEVGAMLGHFWGKAFNEAKHFLYKKWMVKEHYTSCDVDYALFDERALGLKPKMEYRVMLKKED